MKTRLWHDLASAVLLQVFLVCSAQSNPPDGRVSGTLTDASGAPVAGVRVTAESEATRAPLWTATSSTDGAYALVLPAGRYHLRFAHPSFTPREVIVDVAPGQSRALNLRLDIAPASENVVVTANTQPLEVQQTPAPVDLITREDIERQQLVSLSEALAESPGGTIARTGPEGGLTTFFLDGGNSNFTKFFIDGAPVNEPGGILNLSNETLDNVDKIEIVHGAESALYGSDAVAGVVQLFSHQGTTRIPELNLLGEGGSFSSARGAARFSGLLGVFDYSVAGSYFETAGQGPNDAFLNRSFAGNFGYRFSDSNRLRLTVRSNSSFAGIPGQTLLSPPKLSPYDALRILLAHLSWELHTGAHWEHRVSGTENRTVDTNANPPFFSSRDQFNRAGVQEQSTYFFRNGAAALGYEYEVENGFPSLLSGQHARRNNQGGFLDARWLPMSRVTLSAGSRAEDNTTFGTRVVPRAGASLAVRYGAGFWGDTRVRISYGQGFKEPSLSESFGSNPCFPGNNSLKPERSRTIDAGAEQFFASNKSRLSATYFSNRFRDMVSFAFTPPTPGCLSGTGTYFNTDLARSRGVNLTWDLRPWRWLSVVANYSFDDTRVLRAPNASNAVQRPGHHLLRRPLNSANIVLNANYRRWNINFREYLSGVRTDSDFQFPSLGITRNPGYARFDIASSYEWGRGVTFYGRASNLLDKRYQDAVGYPALGRDMRVGLNYRWGGRN